MNIELSTSFGIYGGILLCILITVAAVRDGQLRSMLGLLRFLFRLLGALLLGLILCRPMSTNVEELTDLEILLDISDSMDEARGQQLLDQAQSLVDDGFRLAVRPFAGEVAPLLERGSRAFDYAGLKDSWSQLNIGSSNLERALSEVAYRKDAHILLITDGQETKGDSNRILPVMKGNNVRVFPLVRSRSRDEEDAVRITQLYAPFIVPAKQQAEVRIAVSNSTSEEQTGLLLVKHDEKELLKKEVTIAAETEVLLTTETDASLEGIKEISATFTPNSSRFGVSSEKRYISGEEREKILLLNGVSQDEKHLKKALSDQSYQVDSFVSSGVRLDGLQEFSKYSVVVLNNIPLEELPLGSAVQLKRYVEEGGGLMMLGGNKSLGLGGYIDSPIEEVLPVKLLPPQKEKKRLNVAVQLVLDKSGSMKQGGKINYARLAAKEVVRSLKNADYFGLIAFDDNPFIVQAMGRVAQIRSRAIKAPDDLMHPTGTTNLFPALDMALEQISKVPAGRKHVIILTDGKIPDGYSRTDLYHKIVSDKRTYSGVSVSTFLIGPQSDNFLPSLAAVGGGNFHQIQDARSLPRLFLQDVKVNTGERTQREAKQFDVRKGSGTLLSTKLSSFPGVQGYVQTKSLPKDDANLELVTYANGKAEPLLASRKVKKGKSIAFTSDVSGRWSQYWIRWGKFSQFWTDMMNAVRPDGGDDESGHVKFDLRPFVEKGQLTFDLAVYTTGLQGEVVLEVDLPDGAKRSVPMRAVARGRYQASSDSILAGKYVVRGKIGARALTPIAFHVSGELFGERKGLGTDLANLERIAGVTEGAINPEAGLLSGLTSRQVLKEDVAYAFFLLALFCFLVDILLRERWMFRRLLKNLRGKRMRFQS